MATTLQIRKATRADVATIATLSRELIENGLGWTWTPGRVAHSLARDDTLVIVARDGHRISGFAIMRYGMDEANLDLLGVIPSYQHCGVGRRLLQWHEKVARTAGIGVVRVQVRADRPDALGFYERVGFRVDKRIPGYYRGKVTAVCMVRELLN